MLIPAKTELKIKLIAILQTAYMTQFTGNALSQIVKFDLERFGSAEAKALEFAYEAAGPVADAIYDFVKEIGINITVPPTLISPIVPPMPGGPCTGVIPMTNIKVF